MATTKIWAVRDDVSRVIGYAANPEKTTFDALKQALAYAGNEDKAVHPTDKNERVLLVSGVNCRTESAAIEMESVQERFNKATGIVAYHAYQSFKPGEVTPEQAHEIGVKLARKMWGESFQVLVATHLNTGTYHNHFVVNAVGMWNGKKLRCNKGTYFRFRELSDELCQEYRLTVIENPKGYTARNIYFAEKRGEPTKYNLMRQALEEALEFSTSPSVLRDALYRMGYVLEMNPRHRYATIRRKNEKKATRTFRLGEDYTMDNLLQKLRQNERTNAGECYKKQMEFFHPQQLMQLFQRKPYQLRGLLPGKKITGLRALYFHYCYRLGCFPKANQRKPLSPEMREAWRKIDRITTQVTLIGREKLNTPEDVWAFICRTETEITLVTKARDKVRNKLRNCKDEPLISEHKAQRDQYTATLTQMRKELKIARGILTDVPKIKADLGAETEMLRERQDRNKPKNRQRRKDHER